MDVTACKSFWTCIPFEKHHRHNVDLNLDLLLAFEYQSTVWSDESLHINIHGIFKVILHQSNRNSYPTRSCFPMMMMIIIIIKGVGPILSSQSWAFKKNIYRAYPTIQLYYVCTHTSVTSVSFHNSTVTDTLVIWKYVNWLSHSGTSLSLSIPCLLHLHQSSWK